MLSLKRVLCVCIFFVIGMEGAPKPKPKAEPKPQPKAEPKPFPPIGYPPYSGGYNLPGTNPGPWNWNGFPPTRGANPWQLYWNGSPNLNRGQGKVRHPGEPPYSSDCNELEDLINEERKKRRLEPLGCDRA